MRFRVSHRTAYGYDDDVTASYGVAYLVPRDLPEQEVVSAEVQVSPTPRDTSTSLDAAGNRLTYFQVETAHRELEVLATSVVQTRDPQPDPVASGTPWEALRPVDDCADPLAWRAVDLALPSPLVEPTPELAQWAASAYAPGRPAADVARELMHRIHDEFEYEPGATSVSSTVAEILEARAGVCQDFAHLLIAALRSQGLAARYVSGYIATDPPPGRDRVVGADASHAWAAVWLGGDAWLALDPTNDQDVGERYVTVAWGRDYGDVVPVKGVIFTEAETSTLLVEVDVAPDVARADPAPTSPAASEGPD